MENIKLPQETVMSNRYEQQVPRPEYDKRAYDYEQARCSTVSCHTSFDDAIRSVVEVLDGILGNKRNRNVEKRDERAELMRSLSLVKEDSRIEFEEKDSEEVNTPESPIIITHCSIDDEPSVDLEHEVPDPTPTSPRHTIVPDGPLCSCNEEHLFNQDKVNIKKLSKSKLLRSQHKVRSENKMLESVKVGVMGIDSFGKPMPLSNIKAKHRVSELPNIEEIMVE